MAEVAKVLIEVQEMGAAKAAREIDKLKSSTKGADETSQKMASKGSSSGGLLGFLNRSDKHTSLLTKSMGGLKSMLLTGFALGGLASLGGILKSFVDTTKNVLGETKALHEATGLSAQSSLYAVAAANARGVSEDKLSKALTFAQKNVNATLIAETKLAHARHKLGQETGRLSKDFALLGLNPEEWTRLKPDEKINKLMTAFQRMPDSLRKSALEKELLGRGGTSLAPLLEKGALGWKHQREEAEKYFPKLEGGTKMLNELSANQAKANMAWEGLKVTIGVKLIPVLNELIPKFVELIREIEKGEGIWGTLGRDLETIWHDLEKVWQWFEKNKWAVQGLLALFVADRVLKFARAFSGLGSVLKGLTPALSADAKAGGAIVGGAWGVAFAGAVDAALVFGVPKIIHELVELLSPGYLKTHTLSEVESQIGGGNKKGLRIENGELKPNTGGGGWVDPHGKFHSPEARAFHDPREKKWEGTAAHMRAAQTRTYTDPQSGRTYYLNPGETDQIPGGPQIRLDLHNHIYVDGKQVGESRRVVQGVRNRQRQEHNLR